MFDWLFGRKQESDPTREEALDSPSTRLSTAPDARTTPSVGAEDLESDTPPTDTERLGSRMDGINQQIARLADQAEALQGQLERLDHRASFGNDQLEALVQHLSDVAGWAGPLDNRLAELVTWAEESREASAQLEEGIRKLSRTQFKTNSLAEAQQERLQSALETLQDLATRKQEAEEKARQQQREAVEAARREGRLAMTVDLFPALDGLESALESGRALLDRSRHSAAKPGFLARLAYAFGIGNSKLEIGNSEFEAWLDGLALVRERFLTLLQAEGIQPIRAEGEPFDPHRHVAVEAVERSDVPPGTIVEEHRPGYRLGDRVLRYAEVVVNRDEIEIWHPVDKPEEAPMAAPEPRHPDDELIVPSASSERRETEERPAAADWEAPWTWKPSEPEAPSEEETDETEETEVTDSLDVHLESYETMGEKPEAEEQVEQATTPEPAEGPVLSEVEGPVLSETEESVLSETEGPVLSETEGPVLSETEGPVLSETEESAPSEEEGTEDDTPPQDTTDDTHRLDPEIEEMIARFEARQRARRS